jgi:hypothetical protein
MWGKRQTGTSMTPALRFDRRRWASAPAVRRAAYPRREALAASYVALAVAVITAVLFSLLRF